MCVIYSYFVVTQHKKKDFLAFYKYWESKLEIDLTWGAEKINKHGLATYPFMFFVSFFWVLFAPKKFRIDLDEPFQKIDFGDFGAFLDPNNAFFTHLRIFGSFSYADRIRL